MMIKCKINGQNRCFDVNPLMKLRDMLLLNGNFAVRDSDDGEGFCGSDTVLVDNLPVYANLMLAGEVDGCAIRTPDALGSSKKLTVVQQAMIDAGIVQSAYNSPAAALLLTWLLKKTPDPSREEIRDVLSGIYVRDAGYEHYYLAVKLAVEKKRFGEYKTEISPSFRSDLDYIGKPVAKIDGPQLVAGEKAFVEDYVEKNACFMSVLRSPHASAYINSIDTSEAEKVEGVVAVFTAFNTPETYYMQAGQGNPEPSPYDRRLFNMKVRHVGDRVAAVVAENPEAAEKAKELIKVDYEVLPAVFTVEEAMADGAPVVHNGTVEYRSGAPENLDEYNKTAGDLREGKVIYQFPLRADVKKNIAASNKGSIGNVEKAFRKADAIVERTYQTSQIQHAPLEPHVCYAKTEGGRLTVYASTQVPYHVRRIVSWVTGLSENKIHVIKTRVGGGYGSKQDILIEDLTAYAAFATGRPVYCRNTREEEFIANSTRHPMRVHVKMAGKKNGKITAIHMEVCANTGPYGNHCLTVPMNSCSKTLPLFKCKNMSYDLKVYYTNTPPAGAYQGYGTPKGNFGLMMAMAELADKLGVDYRKMALKNHVDTGYMLEILKGLGEGRDGNVVPVGSCGLDEAIRKGCDMIGWEDTAKKKKKRRKKGTPEPEWKIGKGFAMVMQGSGLPGLDHSEAIAKLETDGSVILHSGGADIGTGLDTISAKIAAEELKLPLDKISVVSGDTDSCAFDTGAYASSGTFFSGNATWDAVKKLRVMILQEASVQMNESIKHLSVVAPGAVKSHKTGRVISFAELSHTACSGSGRGQMIAHGNFVTEASSVPYGAHFAQVAVNTRTGEIKVQKFYALQDAGTPINPELALCQMYGAVMKSIGHTLYEDMKLDASGRCINANMTDYGVPMIDEAPEDFRSILIDVNDEHGPFGAKSISEIACNGAAPAIGIAIHNACGIWLSDWPMTPEKVLRALGKIK
ncbi:MAG: molybdopterin-dependent oxidoreductase Mo/Fe-S-binding subunit [Sphaerochaetaceae bacterium]|nr:molybdopterin-dependent oxidoreductase Mo/Fe-S-binding subunit [Sphaerochaetaceae bacterium]